MTYIVEEKSSNSKVLSKSYCNELGYWNPEPDFINQTYHFKITSLKQNEYNQKWIAYQSHVLK